MVDVKRAVTAALRDGKLPCVSAFRIATEIGSSPAEIGAEVNRLDVRISRCQLGLFGYAAFGQKGLVQTLKAVPDDVTAALRSAAPEGQIACAALWQIAEDQGLPRLAIACAAESLGLRISPCQLGCF